MLTQTHWKETFEFEPWNPDQMKALHYTGLPGGYSTFYYNRLPVTTGLVGAALPKLMEPESGETITVVPPVFGRPASPQVMRGCMCGPQLPQPMSSNETVSIVPPVFGAAAEGYTAGRMALFAVLAVGLGATAGYVASRVF